MQNNLIKNSNLGTSTNVGDTSNNGSPLFLIQSPHHYYNKIYKYNSTSIKKAIPLSDPTTHDILTSHLALPPLRKHEESRHIYLMSRVSELQKAINQLEMLKLFLEELTKNDKSIVTQATGHKFDQLKGKDSQSSNLSSVSNSTLNGQHFQKNIVSDLPTAQDTVGSMINIGNQNDESSYSQEIIQAFLLAKQKMMHLIRKFKKQLISNILYHRYLLQLDWRLCRDNLWLVSLDGGVFIGLKYGENGFVVREMLDEYQNFEETNCTSCGSQICTNCGECGKCGYSISNVKNNNNGEISKKNNSRNNLDLINGESRNQKNLNQNCSCGGKLVCGSIDYIFPQGISFGYKEVRVHMKIKHSPIDNSSKESEDIYKVDDDEEEMEDIQLSGFHIPPPQELLQKTFDIPSQNIEKINSCLNLAHNSLFNLQLFKVFSQIAFQSEDKIKILHYEQNSITVRIAPPNYYLSLKIEKGEDHPYWILKVDQNCILEENGGSKLVKILLEDCFNRVYDLLLYNPPILFQSEFQRRNRLFSKKYFPIVSQQFFHVMLYMRHAVVCSKVRDIAPDIELLRFSYPDSSECVVYIGPNTERRVLIFVHGTQICIGHQKLQLGELKQKLLHMEEEMPKN